MSYFTIDTYGGNIRIGAGDGKAVVMQSVFPAGLVKNQWYHVVLTCDRTGNSVVKCYINGTEVSANAGATQAGSKVNFKTVSGTADVGMAVFMFNTSPFAYFNFSIDELAVWNTVLSGSAISDLYTKVSDYTQNHGNYQSKSNLKRYYKFDEATGSTSVDSLRLGDAISLINSPNWIRSAY